MAPFCVPPDASKLAPDGGSPGSFLGRCIRFFILRRVGPGAQRFYPGPGFGEILAERLFKPGKFFGEFWRILILGGVFRISALKAGPSGLLPVTDDAPRGAPCPGLLSSTDRTVLS